MIVTKNTTVRDVVEADRYALEIFEKHGVSVEYECPDAVLDFEIGDCEDMCHIDDVETLVADLNIFFRSRN